MVFLESKKSVMNGSGTFDGLRPDILRWLSADEVSVRRLKTQT